MPSVPSVNAGLFKPLDSNVARAGIKRDDFFGSMWDSLVWNGKLYAIPLGGASAALAYNMDVFDQAKIPYPTDDMTWDQISDLCKRFTKGEGIQKQFGLAWDMWGEHWEWFNGAYPIKPADVMTGKSHDYGSLLSNEGDPNVTAGRQYRWKLMFDLKTLPNSFALGWGDTLKGVNAAFDASSGKGLNDIPAAQQQAEKDIDAIIAKTKPDVLKQMH